MKATSLLSEAELGPADAGMSGTVIGMDSPDKAATESDVRLADSDIQPAGTGAKPAAAAAKAPAKKTDEVDAKVANFEELDLTLDQDVRLADSSVSVGGEKKPVASDSSVDLSGKKLDDDDMVLGGSGSGSDITIGGDSGISLVDPADSGLSLEEPLNLGAGDESLELGEDDMLTFSADTSSSSPSIKTDDDFQLTPMPESEGDDSESGSQVIALDTEGEGDEGVTMIGTGGSMAAMLDEDLGGEPSLGLAAPMPMTAGGPVEMTLATPGGFAAVLPMMQPVAALPEAPYTAWNILSLVLCSLLLAFAGVMIFDLMRTSGASTARTTSTAPCSTGS